MLKTSTLAALAAAAAITIASPAFAQSYSKGDGTWNNLPFAYGENGAKSPGPFEAQQQRIAAQPAQAGGTRQVAARERGGEQIAARGTRGLYAYAGGGSVNAHPGRGDLRSGLYDYTAVPTATRNDPAWNSPAATGGGSVGYNQMLENY